MLWYADSNPNEKPMTTPTENTASAATHADEPNTPHGEFGLKSLRDVDLLDFLATQGLKGRVGAIYLDASPEKPSGKKNGTLEKIEAEAIHQKLQVGVIHLRDVDAASQIMEVLGLELPGSLNLFKGTDSKWCYKTSSELSKNPTRISVIGTKIKDIRDKSSAPTESMGYPVTSRPPRRRAGA